LDAEARHKGQQEGAPAEGRPGPTPGAVHGPKEKKRMKRTGVENFAVGAFWKVGGGECDSERADSKRKEDIYVVGDLGTI